jgi:hypothetical protein
VNRAVLWLLPDWASSSVQLCGLSNASKDHEAPCVWRPQLLRAINRRRCATTALAVSFLSICGGRDLFLPVSSDSSLLTLLQIVFSSSVSPECIAPESCYFFISMQNHGGDDYGQDGDGSGRCRG